MDLISDLLNDLGIQGIEIEDHVPLTEAETKGMFIDILPELPPDDGRAWVHFYLSADEETKEAVFQCGDAPRQTEEPALSEEELLEAVKGGLEEMRAWCNVGSGAISLSETEDKDWMNAWKDYFKPFAVDRILIRPSWEEIPPEHADKLCVTIDPGTAFGTGTHETTKLCVQQLEKYVKPGMEVLDVGCGSGILGITALRLGAGYAAGTDLDESAITGTLENAARNGYTEKDFQVLLGNILDDAEIQRQVGFGKYDLAVSNILAPVIILLSGVIGSFIKPGALWISSGIVAEKEEEVLSAIRNRPEWEVLEVLHLGEWVSITARNRGNDTL